MTQDIKLANNAPFTLQFVKKTIKIKETRTKQIYFLKNILANIWQKM